MNDDKREYTTKKRKINETYDYDRLAAIHLTNFNQ
jgi:hypothetical protein